MFLTKNIILIVKLFEYNIIYLKQFKYVLRHFWEFMEAPLMGCMFSFLNT